MDSHSSLDSHLSLNSHGSHFSIYYVSLCRLALEMVQSNVAPFCFDSLTGFQFLLLLMES